MNKQYYLGHPDQLAGAEFFRRDGGRADGTKICRVRNGLGLECIIATDRAADVTELTFCGRNMGFLSPVAMREQTKMPRFSTGLRRDFSPPAGWIT